MDVITTSLEALIQRATNPQNQKPDVAAIEAFCALVTKESDGAQIGTKLLASHIQSPHESEALQALTILDTCMRRCGSNFHTEVGKFRFLNEMIRLVSPKYLGNRTPVAVRQRVLQLLYAWTKHYPRESKIKVAYEMLKRQGVIEDDTAPIINTAEDILRQSKKNVIFEDEEKSKLLQKLLQSKDPDDLQTANRLIKMMVKEDERRVQLHSRRIMELESVHNNVKLLSEMLDAYNRNETSSEDVELMKELYQACDRLKPIVLRLANETQDNEEMLGDVLAASDALRQVSDKYTTVIVLGQDPETYKSKMKQSSSLLDLSSPSEMESGLSSSSNRISNVQSDLEVLGDIFNSLEKASESSPMSDVNILIPESTIMQPISILPLNTKSENSSMPVKKIDSKAKALEELNELGESLLKQSLSGAMIRGNTVLGSKGHTSLGIKIANHISENLLEDKPSSSKTNNKDLKIDSDPLGWQSSNLLNGSDTLIDTSELSNNNSDCTVQADVKKGENQKDPINAATLVDISTEADRNEPEIKPLSDINVKLQDITPGTTPPITVIKEKNGISVVLHFAQDSPRADVSVVVVTTMSTNAKSLSNYLFQAVVPKRCKCRLQQPSGTELPGHNPFLPPSAITQIMLIANPHKETVSIKFMLSYTMDNETYTEMGEVDQLPHLQK